MTILPADLPGFPHDLISGLIEGLCGITEIDTEALYRVLVPDDLRDQYPGLYRALEWVEEYEGMIPKVRVQSEETGEIFEMPGILLEKVSPLESLGEQAE